MPRLLFLMLVLLLAAGGTSPAGAAPFSAFRDGEVLTYKVGFALFGRAGEIRIAAHRATGPANQPVWNIATTTASRGFVRVLYAYDNQAEVVIDAATGRLQAVRERGADPRRASDSETLFDYAAGLARHTDRVRPGRSVDLPLPPGDPLDLISALVQTRDWDLRPGDERPLLVHFGNDFYALIIRAEAYEQVRTPLGSYRTLRLTPRLVGEPKGLFKRGGQVRVWIAQDGSRLPVKLQLVLKYGAANLLLAAHAPGTPAPAPAGAP